MDLRQIDIYYVHLFDDRKYLLIKILKVKVHLQFTKGN